MLEDKVIFFFSCCYYNLHYSSGLQNKSERATHVDFNDDGIIGHLRDTIPGGTIPPMN